MISGTYTPLTNSNVKQKYTTEKELSLIVKNIYFSKKQ